MRALVGCALAICSWQAHAQLPTITVEAEHYIEVTGGEVRVIDREAASGGKCVSYWEEPGVAVTVEFEVEQAGTYCLSLKYSCNWEDTRRRIALDGQTPAGFEEVLLPGTGSWADFATITVAGREGGRVRLHLTEGKHTLTLANVDSRGLAWDCALLHDPELMVADTPVSDAELAEFATTLGPTARRVILDGPGDTDLQLGEVVVAFSEQGLPRALRVEDTVLLMPAMPGSAASGAPRSFGAFRLRSASLRPGPQVQTHVLALTEGRCAYLIVASTGEVAQFLLPMPTIAWREGRPFRVAARGPKQQVGEAAATRSYSVNGISVSATGDLHGTEGADPYADPFVVFETLRSGAVSAGAVKVGPSISPGDSTITAEVEGNAVVIRSSKEMYPALEAFYQMPQFDCRIAPDLSLTLTAAGQQLAVPAP